MVFYEKYNRLTVIRGLIFENWPEIDHFVAHWKWLNWIKNLFSYDFSMMTLISYFLFAQSLDQIIRKRDEPWDKRSMLEKNTIS